MKSFLEWLIYKPNDGATTRNYQKSQPNNLFFAGGRFKTVYRNTNHFQLITATIIGAPLIIYLACEASFCWHHISPAALILFVYSWTACTINFGKSSLLDPGVLPRNIHIVDDDITAIRSKRLGQYSGLPSEYLGSITLPGSDDDTCIDIKYCSTCKIWRTPRSSHCSTCQACISKHDHHCVWINNCVGSRNYRFFIFFLIWGVITCIWLITLGFYHVYHYHNAHRDAGIARNLRKTPVAFFLAIYGCVTFWYPALLLSYHSFLAALNITTREYLNIVYSTTTTGDMYKRALNHPYNTGHFMKNLALHCLPIRGSSLVDWKDKYSEGDTRYEKL